MNERPQRDVPRSLLLTLVLLVPMLLLWFHRAPRVFFQGRFWAEEGTTFFQHFVRAPWFDRLSFIHLGHLQLTTNLAVSAATLVPFDVAPRVTSYVGFALQVLPLVLLLAERKRLGLTLWQIELFGFALMLLPSAPEVFANTTSAQSLMAANTCTLLALPTGPTQGPLGARGMTFTARGLLLLGGLSGVPSTFWFPGFVLRAWLDKDRERVIQAAILGLCAVIQLGLLLHHGSQRPFAASPVLIYAASVMQVVISPLLGVSVADAAGKIVRANMDFAGGGGWILLGGGLGLLALVLLCLRSASTAPRALLLGGTIAIVLGVFGSLDPPMTISGRAGGRYFYAPVCGLMLALLLALVAHRTRRGVALASLLMLLIAVAGARTIYRPKPFVRGASWRDQVRSLDASVGGRVEIWPRNWFVDLPPVSQVAP
jgi:hypothetical protein